MRNLNENVFTIILEVEPENPHYRIKSVFYLGSKFLREPAENNTYRAHKEGDSLKIVVI